MANFPVKRLFGRVNVIVAAAARTLTRDESGSLVCNTGAEGSVTVSLPAAEAGLQFMFYVDAAQAFVIDCASGDTIQVGTATASTAGGTQTADAVGEYLHIVCINATEWVAVSSAGTWTASA
jgi:hypothetical protein